MMFALATGEIIGIIAFAILAVGGGATLLVQKGRTSVADTYKQLYEAQKAATDDERGAREREQRDCATRIASLEGRVATMESSWLQSVSIGVAEAVRDVMQAMEERRREERRQEP